jgi:hypothetical protein
MFRRIDISSILALGAGPIAALAITACATRDASSERGTGIGLRQEFEEARTNCGLPRLLMQASDRDPRVLLFRFPQRYDAPGSAERDGSLACLTHWAHERGLILRHVSHQELPGE